MLSFITQDSLEDFRLSNKDLNWPNFLTVSNSRSETISPLCVESCTLFSALTCLRPSAKHPTLQNVLKVKCSKTETWITNSKYTIWFIMLCYLNISHDLWTLKDYCVVKYRYSSIYFISLKYNIETPLIAISLLSIHTRLSYL